MSNIWSRLINLAGNITGTLPVANGGTGLTAGTSGGIPAYTGTGTIASSALLTQYGVVLGGGSAAVPTVTAAGTSGQLLAGINSGPPVWTNTITSATTFSGQLIGKGTATNDSAAAGYIGEYIESTQTTATNVGASTQWADAGSVALTAGDWDVTFQYEGRLNGATGLTGEFEYGISQTTGNSATGLTRGVNYFSTPSPTSAANISPTIPVFRVSLSGSATVYGKLKCQYSGGNPQWLGRLSARRVR